MSSWYMSQQNELLIVQLMVGRFIGEAINLPNDDLPSTGCSGIHFSEISFTIYKFALRKIL